MGKGRAPCCDKTKVKKGPWSPAEDSRLANFIQKHGHSNWRALPKQAGLLRCGKSCRLRWINYLRPDVKRGNFTPQEEQTIINLHNTIGNKWSKIASYLPGRTDNEIKNVWNTHLKKRLTSKKSAPENELCSNTSISGTTSCTSSSITSLTNHQPGQESELEKSNEKTECLEVNKWSNSTDGNESKLEAMSSTYDSPTSSYGSNFSNEKKSNEASEFSMPDPNIGKFEIPLESDIDFWELFDSLDANHHDPVQPDPNIIPGPEENPSSEEVECSKWFRLLENELGLTSDVDKVAEDLDTEMADNLEPEISYELDYFPIWPSSPQNLGI